MLEIVELNYKLYRFREEDPATLLLYNVRTGDIHFLTGRAKMLISNLKTNCRITVDTDEKIPKYLKIINAIKRC